MNSLLNSLYLSPTEEARHMKAIQRLAGDVGSDIAVVKAIYEAELARLQEGARLRDYLPLLTARHTLDYIRSHPR
jgi:hypothetical protein